MKKKLALAAALIPNPDLLFLDEPFEGWTLWHHAYCATSSSNVSDAARPFSSRRTCSRL